MSLVVTEGDARAFFDAPFAIHSPSVGYVSPMRGDLLAMLAPSRNPLLREGAFAHWTARRNGMPVGRVLAFEHRASNRRHGTSRLQFGFLDVVDDPEVASALLGRVEDLARRLALTQVAGPFDMTAMQQMGVVTSGFGGRAYTDMAMNPAYLPDLLESIGYERFFPMTTFELDVASATVGSTAALDVPGMRLEPIVRRVFAKRMEEARAVLNDGFDRNPMFVPLTDAEFSFQAGGMMSILDPRLSSILTRDGVPIAAMVCIPDLSGFMAATRSRIGIATPFHFLRHRMTRDRAVIVFYSVATAEHGRGINGAMLSRLLEILRRTGYASLGITWIGDGNAASLRQMERVGARPLHRLHMFRKDVG